MEIKLGEGIVVHCKLAWNDRGNKRERIFCGLSSGESYAEDLAEAEAMATELAFDQISSVLTDYCGECVTDTNFKAFNLAKMRKFFSKKELREMRNMDFKDIGYSWFEVLTEDGSDDERAEWREIMGWKTK